MSIYERNGGSETCRSILAFLLLRYWYLSAPTAISWNIRVNVQTPGVLLPEVPAVNQDSTYCKAWGALQVLTDTDPAAWAWHCGHATLISYHCSVTCTLKHKINVLLHYKYTSCCRECSTVLISCIPLLQRRGSILYNNFIQNTGSER